MGFGIMDIRFETIIVDAGPGGCAAAYELAAAGGKSSCSINANFRGLNRVRGR